MLFGTKVARKREKFYGGFCFSGGIRTVTTDTARKANVPEEILVGFLRISVVSP